MRTRGHRGAGRRPRMSPTVLRSSPCKRNRRVHHDHVRPGDGAEGAVRQSTDPRDRAAVVEAQHQLRAHRDAAALAANEPDDVRVPPAGGMKSMTVARAFGRLDGRLEDQRIRAIAAGDSRAWIDRFHEPSAVVRRAEQCGEARARIEPRPAEPVNRAAARHQRGGLTIADERVILEWGAHRQRLAHRRYFRTATARSSSLMSIFFIRRIASIARRAVSELWSFSNSGSILGTTCHERPY